MSHSPEIKERFIELRAKGYSFDRIAQEMKLGKQTLLNWNREFKDEIANRKAVELEALQEKYYLSLEKSITFFGDRLEQLLEELNSRDLSDIPTDKLFDLTLKYHAQLKELSVTPNFLSEGELQQQKEERALLETISKLAQDRKRGGGLYGT